MKKLMTVLLTVMMAFSVLTVNVLAEPTETTVEQVAAEPTEEKTEIIDEVVEEIKEEVEVPTEAPAETSAETEEPTEEIKEEVSEVEKVAKAAAKPGLQRPDFKKVMVSVVFNPTGLEYGDEIKFSIIRDDNKQELNSKYYDFHFEREKGPRGESVDANKPQEVGSWKLVIELKGGKKDALDAKPQVEDFVFKDGSKKFESKVFEIRKKSIPVPEAKNIPFTYNGEEQYYKNAMDEKTLDMILKSYPVVQTGTWSAKDARSYTAILKITDTKHYVWKAEERKLYAEEKPIDDSEHLYHWSIEKKEITLEDIQALTRTYNGNTQKPFDTLPEGTAYGYSFENEAVNARDRAYNAVLYINVPKNYEWGKDVIESKQYEHRFGGYVNVPWTINKASVTVQANATRTYGYDDKIVEFAVTGDGAETIKKTGDFDYFVNHGWIDSATPDYFNNLRRDAGSYVGKVNTLINKKVFDNYQIMGIAGDLTIKPAPLSFTLEYGETTYNGGEQKPAIIWNGFVGKEAKEGYAPTELDYVAVYSDIDVVKANFSGDILFTKDVGKKYVYVGLLNSIVNNLANNYELVGQEEIKILGYTVSKFAQQSFEVTPAPLTIKINDAKMYKKKAYPEFTATVEGLVGNEGIQFDYVVEGDTTVKGECKINVDNIQIVEPGYLWDDIVDPYNYDVTINKGTLTVKSHHKVDDTVKIVATGIE